MGVLLLRVVRLAQNWIIPCPASANKEEDLAAHLADLSAMAKRPEMILEG